MRKIANITSKLFVLCLVIAVVSSSLNHTFGSVLGIVNALQMDAEAKFVVYPNGTVALSSNGNLNLSSMYPITGIPPTQVQAQLIKSDGQYNALINATSTIPSEQASTFPYNATTANIITQYSNDLETSTINAHVTLPDSFAQGSTDIDFTGFPFNSTDFSITGNYTNQEYNGTLSIQLVPGLSFGAIEMDFEGNLTQVTLSDSVIVHYNYTFPVPGFPTLDETTLNTYLAMLNSTIPGMLSGSLYDMTNGVLQCTTFNTTVMQLDSNTVEVSFLVIVQGDFLQLVVDLANSYGQSMGFYGQDMYSLLNTTVSSVKNVGFQFSYSKDIRRVDFQAIFAWDPKEYLNASMSMLPSSYPPELLPYLESMLNTSYASLESYAENISYANSQIRFEGDYTITGDINAQVNSIKNTYIDMLNATSPYYGSIALLAGAKTTTIDIADLRLNFSMDESSVAWEIEGIKVTPTIRHINATTFALESFFNMTSVPPGGFEPPVEGEKLELVVQGGSNGTHTVTLGADATVPYPVPAPDTLAEENTAVWNNQSISNLRHLAFRVWEGYAEAVFNATSISPSNPYTIDANQSANCMLILNSISTPATFCIKNVTTPTDVGNITGTYKLLGNYVQITSDVEGASINATIRVYYTPEQLSALGLDENSLKIFHWNVTTSNWEAVDTQVNTSDHYAWATINHLSTWALLGQSAQSIFGQSWFQMAIAAIVVIVVIIAAAALLLRKKKPAK
ncbi:MAG TPA: hypothetical protein VIH48_04815 [Candidatus Bathyarchaeia archaeon]